MLVMIPNHPKKIPPVCNEQQNKKLSILLVFSCDVMFKGKLEIQAQGLA